MKQINIVVFSKNRAMQLDLFLRSFHWFVDFPYAYQINVIYTYTNDSFKQGYDKLQSSCPENVSWEKEGIFKENLLGVINFNLPYTVFFVDDDVFKKPFSFFDHQMDIFDYYKDIACRSLRLHRWLEYCYPKQQPMRQPVFDNNNVFTWKGQDGDYGYPMSLDGHVFRTEDIADYIKQGEYSNPNLLESIMAGNPINKPKMICYNQSVIINNPLNRVQTLNNNVHGSVTAKELNDRWLDGFRLSLTPFIELNNISCHQEIEPVYERNSD